MSKQVLTILGLNSGTSTDGVDMAVVKITRRSKNISFKYITGKSRAYPKELRSRILNLADSNSTSLDEIISTDNDIGTFFGETAANFSKILAARGISIDAVASHGQTVRHIPIKQGKSKKNGTLQLGSLEHIAASVNKVTVGDFRQADIALGNEGAPITVAAMQRLFAIPTESRLIVNIGGISNFFYFPMKKKGLTSLAADCGPGNVLSDILSEKLFKKKFDKNGMTAQKGKLSKRILTLLLAEPFFNGKTVSTGREEFGKNLAERIIKLGKKFNLNNADIVSTVAELTVIAIINQIRPLLKRDSTISKLYLTGGGKKNNFFVKRLKEELKGIKILPADNLGVNADYVEASAYAVMAEATLRSEPLPTVFTGKKSTVPMAVLGKIVQPPDR